MHKAQQTRQPLLFWAGWQHLCGRVCWLMCCAVLLSLRTRVLDCLLSCDWSPAERARSAVTLVEEPVKAGGGWKGIDSCARGCLPCFVSHDSLTLPVTVLSFNIIWLHLQGLYWSRYQGLRQYFNRGCLLFCWLDNGRTGLLTSKFDI